MKLGEVLKKERRKKGLSAQDTAARLGISPADYASLEAGESPAEKWGPILAEIAIALETPTSRLWAESGRSEDCRPGQAGLLIARHRKNRGLSAKAVATRIAEKVKPLEISFGLQEFRQVEAGESPLETVGPQLLAFAAYIEQPVFNLFYPCGLPFSELDDYP